MKERPSDGKRRERPATLDEVRKAIELLTEADTAKLKAFAEVLAFGLRRRAWSVDAGDLLQEAVISVLEEDRRHWWPSQVDSVGFLIGAMRSIASNWKRRGEKSEPPPVLAADLIPFDETEENIPSVFENARDPRPNPEEVILQQEHLTEQQLIAQIEELFGDDLIASLILDGWKSGMKGPQIIESLEISRREFSTAVRRIRRAVIAHWPKGKPYVQ